MKKHLNKIWYKDYLWYFKIFTAGLALGFLIYGFYMDVFVEYWYIKPFSSIVVQNKFFQNGLEYRTPLKFSLVINIRTNIKTCYGLIQQAFLQNMFRHFESIVLHV